MRPISTGVATTTSLLLLLGAIVTAQPPKTPKPATPQPTVAAKSAPAKATPAKAAKAAAGATAAQKPAPAKPATKPASAGASAKKPESPAKAESGKPAAEAKPKDADPKAEPSEATKPESADPKPSASPKNAETDAKEAGDKKTEDKEEGDKEEEPKTEAEKKQAEKEAAEKKKAEEEKKAQEEKQKKAERKAKHLQKIQNLSFDRRPSAVLKAWCGLADEEEAEAEKKRKEKEAEAKKRAEEAGIPVEASGAAAAILAQAPAGLSPEQRAALMEAVQNGAVVSAPGSSSPDGEKPDEKEEADPFDEEIKTFAKNVTLGKWAEVKAYIAKLDKDEAEALYNRLLAVLQAGAGGGRPSTVADMLRAYDDPFGDDVPALPGSVQGKGEQHIITLDDVFALADAAPFELDKDNTLASLGILVNQAIAQGHVIEGLIHRLKLDVEKPGEKATFSKRLAARLLCLSGHSLHAGEFLPEIDIAKTNKDHEALNLLSQYLLAVYAKDSKIADLEQAWEVTQAILADQDTIELEQKQEALARAVGLAPKIRKEIGRKWLEESFTKHPQRGMEIVATIGTAAAQATQRHRGNPDQRLKSLTLQTTSVEALLAAAPEKAEDWRPALTILAANWLNEAALSHRLDTSTSYGPMMQRDSFGNIFYFDMDDMNRRYGVNRNEPRPIRSGDLLRIKPSDTWLEFLPDLKPRMAMLYAQLLLKVNEEDAAFPYIEELAKTHPGQAEKLAEEFLRVWTRNHDPNASRNRTNQYMFMYGFERRAEGIPLTRSKQERNLKELSGWVKRLGALPLEQLDERLLAQAFTKCHSAAEIYRLDAIEQIFGSMDTLQPKTIAELMQQMRTNLVGQWRKPDLQKKSKTNRKQKDIEAEILRGYQLARDVLEKALEKHPGEWRLVLAKASLDHDENNFRSQLTKDPKFSENRRRAMADFARAAELYAKAVPELEKDETTSEAFDVWFYASLGECDLGRIDEETSPILKQPKLIREAILALPGEAAEKHMGMFANNIFTRMSAVKPAVKFRYLRGAFEIVGDHKQAHEARKVYDYYKDLVTEIKLEAVVDGSDTVAASESFGVFVNILHTKEIERESGGFGRYLQNQNNSTSYYYNYGRPKANYRERFEEVVEEALAEHFEIVSVTFQTDKVHSRATKEYGWRVTPYAYLLLKPRGEEVDKIQPLRLDFDFLDTSGYVVLPVESPAVPIEVAKNGAPDRPVDNIEVTQILDERQSDKGKLLLEIKAVANGLIPPLNEIVDIGPKDFDVVETDDQGLAVSKFAEDTDQTCIVSERSWIVTLQAKEGLKERPAEFAFAEPKMETAKSLRQRYQDADLVPAKARVTLHREYGEPSRAGYWILAAGVAVGVLLLVIIALIVRAALRERTPVQSSMPREITPFSVLSLLWAAQRNQNLSEEHREELSETIEHIEGYYFVESGNGVEAALETATDGGRNGAPNLEHVARTWSRRI